jgi:hypothetical protein
LTANAQLYKWTDERGRVHITDTPPPASAKSVQKKAPLRSPTSASPQQPYELSQALKDFPVTLYTAPNCAAPCEQARGALNKRGVPFKEIMVGDAGTLAELRQFASGNDVPVLLVGRSVHEGFQQEAFDALLDSARYPRAGVLPARAQAAPPPAPKSSSKGTAAPAAEEPRPTGPYAPRPPR